jgi:nitroreductase
MELESAIKGRRSVRSYTDEPVPVELVRKVIEAGTWAPSGHNGQAMEVHNFHGIRKRGVNRLFPFKASKASQRDGIKINGFFLELMSDYARSSGSFDDMECRWN